MSRTILLADDSLAIQRVVELTFEGSELDVVALGSGDEALQELSRLDPTVVIADVHMPGASGYEVARRVKAERPGTPVLLLVGTFEAFDEEESEASGADDHMLKPFESDQLRERVESLIRSAEPTTAAGPSSRQAPADDSPSAEESPGEQRSGEERSGGEPAAALPSSEEEPATDETTPDETTPVEAKPVEARPVESSVPPDSAAIVAAASRAPEPQALDAETIDRIARRVVELISAERVERVAREVVPRMAEEAVRRRIEELERDVE